MDGERSGRHVGRWEGDAAEEGVQHGGGQIGPVVQDEVVEEGTTRSGRLDVHGAEEGHVERAVRHHREDEVLIVPIGFIGSAGVGQLSDAIGHGRVRHQIGVTLRDGASGTDSHQGDGKQQGPGPMEGPHAHQRVSVMRMRGDSTSLEALPARSVIRKVRRVCSSPPLPSRKRGGRFTRKVPSMSSSIPSGVNGGTW